MLNTASKWLLVLLLLLPEFSQAHEARPLYLQINEVDAQQSNRYHYTLRMQIPPSIEADNRPYIILPQSCRHERQGLVMLLNCASALPGQTLSIQYPKFNPSIATLIRVALRSGETHQKMLSPSETQWRLPTQESAPAVVSEYTRLGIEHILMGWDHLLFLLCLLTIAGTLKRTLVTISGFTLSHSLTLVLTALGLIRAPIAPVEAAIALSILFLAAEIARNRRQTLAWRYPVCVSTLFGLVHGFGFATALREIGLPQTELTSALLFFNIGVEIGQVLFVTAVMTLFFLLGRWRSFPLARLQHLMMYGAGSLAAFWTIERVAGF